MGPTDLTNAAAGGDLSRKAVEFVFGNPLAGGGSAGGEVLGTFFLTFNAALFALGVSWFAWSVMSATVHTATDGEFLGKRYSTFWFTIRGVLGFAGLVPVAKGWSLAQIAMYSMAIMGIGLANLLAGGVGGSVASLSALKATPTSEMQRMADPSAPASADSVELARAVYQSQLCVQGVNRSAAEMAAKTGTEANSPGLACGHGFRADGTAIEYRCGYPSSTPAGADASCGGVNIQLAQTQAAGVNPGALAKARLDALTTLEGSMKTLAARAVDSVDFDTYSYQYQQTEMEDYWDAKGYKRQREVQRTRTAFGDRPKSATPAETDTEIASAAKAYEQSVAQAAQAQLTAAQPVIQQTLSQAGGPAAGGWASFGTAFNSYASQVQALSDATTTKAEALAAQPPASFGSAALYLRAADVTLAQQTDSPEATQGGSIWRFFAGIPVAAMKWISNPSESGVVNPVAYSKTVGDTVLTGTEAALGTYIVAKGAIEAADRATEAANGSAAGILANAVSLGSIKAFTTGATGAIKAMLDGASPVIMGLVGILILIGGVLSVWIPLVPFIAWWSAMIQWFVVVAESIVAAPFWAFSHLDADGEGLGQRTQHGYIFALNVLARPALMVISFMIATLASMSLGGLMVELLGRAIPQVQAASMTGLVSFVFFLVVFMALTLALVHTTFAMVGLIPDQVLSWVGGQISSTLGRDHDQHMRNTLVAVPRPNLTGRPGAGGPTPSTTNTLTKGD